MRKILTVAGIAVALLVVGGVAVASIPDASGVINGCRKNSDGSLRVIDTATTTTCPTGWTRLNWSQTGPPGISGLVTVQATGTIPPQSSATVAAFCPPGKSVLGGGVISSFNDAVMMGSAPNVTGGGNGNGWTGLVRNVNPTGPITADAWAICATVAA